MSAAAWPRSVVVPAAGLGTRLAPLTLGAAKELLPLGAYPALTATLLEATAAGVRELIVVTAPSKPQLSHFFTALQALASHPQGAAPQTMALAQLLTGLSVRLVEQPAAFGVLESVSRGLLLTEAPCAVVFPDLVHLPDQTALTRLFAAHAACGQAVIGLRRSDPARPGGNAVAVQLAPGLDRVLQKAAATGEPLPIYAVAKARGEPGELLTTFGQIHTTALGEAINACCRVRPEAPLADDGFVHALQLLASTGKLYGVLLPGEVIDLGSLPGYLDAAGRFLSRRAGLRGLP